MKNEDSYTIYRFINGDIKAFNLLMSKYRASVYTLAVSKLRNFHDAEDVTQEIFIKVYERLHTLKNIDNFPHWLYVITLNDCKNWLRSKSRRPDNSLIDEENSNIIQNRSLDIYHESLKSELIYEALGTLPEVYSQILMLRYLAGMNSTEISEFTGQQPATVRKTLSRARIMLTEELFSVFNKPSDKWILHSCTPEVKSGKWKLEGDILRYKGSPARAISYMMLGHRGWTDYTISCKARMLKAFGQRFSRIIFGIHIEEISGINHIYNVFGPTPWGNCAGIGLFMNDKSITENWKMMEMDMERWYDFRIEVTGNQQKLYIDGDMVVRNQLSNRSSGRLGIGCVSAEVEFTDAVITFPYLPDSLLDGYEITFLDNPTFTWGKIRRQK